VEKEKTKHVCLGCGSCYRKEVALEKLVKESVRNPERFKKGVYARQEVLKALEEESEKNKLH